MSNDDFTMRCASQDLMYAKQLQQDILLAMKDRRKTVKMDNLNKKDIEEIKEQFSELDLGSEHQDTAKVAITIHEQTKKFLNDIKQGNNRRFWGNIVKFNKDS